MKFLPTLLAAAGTTITAVRGDDFFFRFIGGNPTITGQRLRLNTSFPHISPGVTPGPYNPADHFSRIYINESEPLRPGNVQTLYVVPTNPHPPPVPGYYGLSGAEGVDSAYRLKQSYRPQDEGAGWTHDGWRLVKQTSPPPPGSCGGGEEKILLRYGGEDPAAEPGWHWIAVREPNPQGVDRWVAWWVKNTPANAATLGSWDWDVVDLELVPATGPVNSGAPGGVEE